MGAAITAIQQMTPASMRATIGALYIFVVNIIGLALGPSATAIVGDTFFPTETGIRYAIVWTAALGFLIAGVLFTIAALKTAKGGTLTAKGDAPPAPFLAAEPSTES